MSHPPARLLERCVTGQAEAGVKMSKLKLSQMVSAISELTWLQRRELIGRLQAAQGQEQVHAIVEDR